MADIQKKKTRELIKLSEYDKTGKLGDRTFKEVLFGGPKDVVSSPVAALVGYIAGKAGLLDKKKKQKYETIDGMKLAVRGRKAASSAEKD